MRVLLSTYGSRGDGEPMVGLAARLRALGAELLPRRAAGLVAAPFDTAAAVTEGCDELAVGGMTPVGVRLCPGMRW